MTATATARTRAKPPPTDRRLAAVDGLLDRGNLDLRVPREWAVKALVLTLERHRVGSKTAALVGAALTASRGPEHERPLPEQAVRRLISRGQPSYAKAIAGEIGRMEASAAARPGRLARHAERLDGIAATTGPAAAQAVANFWRQYGRAPGPGQIARRRRGDPS
jgi:hypothetical protein